MNEDFHRRLIGRIRARKAAALAAVTASKKTGIPVSSETRKWADMPEEEAIRQSVVRIARKNKPTP